MVPIGRDVTQMTSARLTEDEWTLLLDVYLSHRGERLTAHHPVVIEASEILTRLGRAEGRDGFPTFRSPDGLRRQLRAFDVLDGRSRGRDAKSALYASEVWRRYEHSPEACAAAARAIRLRVRCSSPD